MKKVLILITIVLSGPSTAETWGPEIIKFKLETASELDTMRWISGFSYSSTAYYQRCGSLSPSDYIGSKYLIEKLNEQFTGKTITSEEATKALDEALNNDYSCKAL